MNDSNKPISAFDEICNLTAQTMGNMELDDLRRLLQQAEREASRADIAVRGLRKAIRDKLLLRNRLAD